MLGATYKDVQSMLRTAAAFGGVVGLWEILGKSSVQAEAGYLCEKASKRSSIQVHKLGGAGSSGNHHGEYMVLVRLIEHLAPGLAPTCAGCEGGYSAKEQ